MKISDAEYEEKLTESYLSGVASGFDQIGRQLRKMAGQAYETGLDERARLLRQLAEDTERQAKEAEIVWHNRAKPIQPNSP